MSPTYQTPSTPKVWLVTGASTGFGRLITEHALENGDFVVATLRKPSTLSDLSARYPSSQLLVLPLDVSDAAAIAATFTQAVASFGRIDVVLNNAGFLVNGEAEGMSDKNSRAMFDTLFWGASNVMKEAIRCFRDVNRPVGGQLLNISSRSALIPPPASAMYAAAKSALESLTEGYIAELDPKWNIRLVLIQPSLFRTSACASSTFEPPPPAYARNPSLPTMKYRGKMDHSLFDGDPKKFAELVGGRLVNTENLPSLVRLPLHRVALAAARTKGQMYVEAAGWSQEWSDDLYFPSGELI